MVKNNFFFSLGLVMVVLCACSSKRNSGDATLSDYNLDTDVRIYVCEGEDFRGYLVADAYDEGEACNTGRLYIDCGELYAEPQRVSLHCKGDEVLLQGEDLELQACDLRPYEMPSQKQSDLQSLDYCKPIYDVKVTSNVVYARADGYWTSYPETFEDFSDIFLRKVGNGDAINRRMMDLDMDIYEPEDEADSDVQRPLLVMIHGGGFFNGDKADEEYRLWCRMFAQCGYTAVSINYRLGFFPANWNVARAAYRAVQDARAAVCYMLAHRYEYHVDPYRIYMAGCSAGAITALNTAFMETETRPFGCGDVAWGIWDEDMGDIDKVAMEAGTYQPFVVRAVCNMWGGVFDTKILDSANTRILSIQSKHDPVVPAGRDYPFETIYRKAYLLKPFLEFLTPMLSGSMEIERKHREGDQFVYYDEDRHTLIRYYHNDPAINERHKQFFDLMAEYFSEDMRPTSGCVAQQWDDEQVHYLLGAAETSTLQWNVTSGVVTQLMDDDRVRVLLFSDESDHAVTAEGMYTVRFPFKMSKYY